MSMDQKLPRIIHMKEYIQLFTGTKFYFLNPKPEMFNLRDVCRSLALINRFQGHTIRPYSVAEHSIRCLSHVSEDFGKKVQLEVLIHDFTEAYYLDLPSPVKRKLGKKYRMIEDAWSKEIHKILLGYAEPQHQELIKSIDYRMCATEARDLCNHEPWWSENACYTDPIPRQECHWTVWEDRLLNELKRLLPIGKFNEISSIAPHANTR